MIMHVVSIGLEVQATTRKQLLTTLYESEVHERRGKLLKYKIVEDAFIVQIFDPGQI